MNGVISILEENVDFKDRSNVSKVSRKLAAAVSLIFHNDCYPKFQYFFENR